MKSKLELEREHNFLVESKMNLLLNNGISDSSDNAYKKLPRALQLRYLSIQSDLDLVQKEMMRSFIPSL